MINYIWGVLIVLGIFFSILTGNIKEINSTILISANDGLKLMLEILPTIVLWTGILKIAEKSLLLDKFANFLRPILSKLFPSVDKNNKALGYISSNIAANMMGLGSAATPAGLKAMEELQKINVDKTKASTPMVTFLILNTAGVTLIPTTILALRTSSNSSNPYEIILPAIIATSISLICGLLFDYIIRKKKGKI